MIKQCIFRERAELLIQRKISRKTLSEWEKLELFPKGIEQSIHKLYPEYGLHDLHAGWLLVNGPQLDGIKCTYREAAEIRKMVTEAQKNDTLDNFLVLFGSIDFDETNSDPDYIKLMDKLIAKAHLKDRKTILGHFWLRYRTLSSKDFEDPVDTKPQIITADIAQPSPNQGNHTAKIV